LAVNETGLWIELLRSDDLRIRLDALKYLTDRRDGKGPMWNCDIFSMRCTHSVRSQDGSANLLLSSMRWRPWGEQTSKRSREVQRLSERLSGN